MRTVHTQCRVLVYESDTLPHPNLLVESHWNYRDRVVLVTPNGERLTILAADLHLAVNRCSG